MRLVCESHLKEFIREKAARLRPGWECRAVSGEAVEKIDAKLRAMVIEAVKRHPTVGKTFKQV